MKKHHAVLKGIAEGVRTFFRRTFTAVEVCGPPLDRDVLSASPLLVASTHRSQCDYFLLGQTAYDLGVKNMRFAAGENLTSLPLFGRRLQALGAFPIRRGKTLGKEYIRNLAEDVVHMLRDGDSIIVFPEAGRSYGGDMMEIRGGIMGAGVLAQVRDPSRDVLILPVAISYEQLPELRYFDVLQRGRAMRKPGRSLLSRTYGSLLYFGADAVAFGKFVLARRVGIRYGAVYIDHAAPLPLRSLVDLDKELIPDARDDFAACRAAIQQLSLRMRDVFLSLYRLLPQHLLARVLTDSGETTRAQAAVQCRELSRRLAAQGRNMRSLAHLSGEQIVDEGIRQLEYSHALRLGNGHIGIDVPWLVAYHAASAR